MVYLTKKGSTIVEAALIFPIVILAVAAVLSYASIYYEEVCDQTESHVMEREEAMVNGEITIGEAEFIRSIDFLMEAR
jgi:hypothetical protein